MSVFRVCKNKNFTTMSNYHFRDKNLSWKAKGLLSQMLSLPDDWDYSLAGLIKLSTDGESSTRSALKELENSGYLIRKAIRKKGKIIDWEYIIFEIPNTNGLNCEKPLVENPQLDNPIVENQVQLNTNILNTKKSIIKKNNIIEQSSTLSAIKEIVDYLNLKAGTSYKHTTKDTQKHIKARLDEGYSVDDFKKVIDNRVSKWKGTDMQDYLRPSTLFTPTNFENYLNSKEQVTNQNNQNSIKTDNNDLYYGYRKL